MVYEFYIPARWQGWHWQVAAETFTTVVAVPFLDSAV